MTRALDARRSALRLSRTTALTCTALLCTAGCTRDLWRIQDSSTVAFTTGGLWSSMIYLAKTDSGVVAIDLGWVGAERSVTLALARLQATPADVRYVFLTHAHRDHIAAWPLLRRARFVLGVNEVSYFIGTSHYRAPLPRLVDALIPYAHPPPGALDLIALGGDSAIVLGHDTLFAYSVPGHTPGSTAYLFRGVLFAGDAVNWRPWTGFRGTRREFSDDWRESRASMRNLWARIDSTRVRVACSAHGKCGAVDASLRAATVR